MIMDWSEFIKHLLEQDLVLSSDDAEQLTGIRQPIIDRWKSKPLKRKVHRDSIRKLQDGLKIKIDDSDPEKLTYRLISEMVKEGNVKTISIFKYPILSQVYAGSSMNLFVQENISDYVNLPYEKNERCFALRVHGNSMNHKIEEGDIVLADMDKEVVNGCIVICRLKDGKQIIKRYRELQNDLAMFYSDNGSYEPLTISKTEIEAIYRIVGIWKKL